MIKFVRKYNDRYGYTHYDVVHETNGNRRWFFYEGVYSELPKTVKKFIEKSTESIPYKNDIFQEYGTVYK